MDRAERRRQERRARREGQKPEAAAAPRTQPIAASEAMRLADTYRQQGRLPDAYRLYRRVLSTYPDHAESLDGCGVVAFQLGRTEEAIRHLKRAVATRHDFAGAHHNLAVALRSTGRLDEAAIAGERAIRFGPGSIDAHVHLGQILRERGDLDEALRAYHRAAELEPGDPRAHFQLGLTLHQLDRLDGAVESFERALQIQPGHAEIHYSLGTVLHAMARLDDALAAYDQAITLKPALLEGLFDVGKPRHIHALFERGEHRRALASLDSFLARKPGQSCALALKAIALDEVGERAHARSLVDFDRLIRPVHLDAPPEVDDLGGLNRSLAEWIKQHPTLHEAPAAFSVHRGLSTGELLREPRGPVRTLERMIRSAIDGYRQNLPNAPDHPFIANLPARWHLTMWAIIIEAEGFQVPHIHPSGWLSGVYYVALPDVVAAPDGERAGWIEFGEPYADIAHTVPPELEAFRPEEGLLLMFPSYFYHRTLPFESDQQRISVSFDVVPTD